VPEVLGDVRQDAFEILHYVPILQPDDGKPYTPQVTLARLIVAGRAFAIVRGSFEFNDQSLGRTVEVDDIGADALLTPEFAAVELCVL
jgi:hypothetical protein